MGAPAIAVTTLAKTRIGRKVTAGLIIALLTIAAAIVAPLIAIPLAIAGQQVTHTVTNPDGLPAASGEWGYPLSGSYNTGRGFGYRRHGLPPRRRVQPASASRSRVAAQR